MNARPRLATVVTALGVTQIFAWGSSYYLPAVLAVPIAADTGWKLPWIIGGLSIGLLVAGLASAAVGRAVARLGGRPVLAFSALALALGLVILALSPSLPVFILGWAVLGLGMASGLYDPAFATLGRLYGETARSAITSVTLFGGFASTVCWPLTAWLNGQFGWRTTCLCYAGFQLLVALPLYWWTLPREERRDPPRRHAPEPTPSVLGGRGPERLLFTLMAAAITLGSVISAALSVHLINLLQARGLDLATAVGLGALVGPAQVSARAIEMAVGRFHHPIWTKLASTFLVAIGLLLLSVGFPIIAVALVCYGGGIGLESIARGTLPLSVFGAEDYPAIMGRIARPSLLAQAAAPSALAALITSLGPDGALQTMAVAAVANLILAITLGLVLNQRTPRRRPVPAARP